MSDTCMKTTTGKMVDLANFNLSVLDVKDIETSLNMTYRFNGHFMNGIAPLTVAQHSLLCYDLALAKYPKEKFLHLCCFTHDFAEAYIGDLSSPMKKLLGKAWYETVEPIESQIESIFNGPRSISEDIRLGVKEIDQEALILEQEVEDYPEQLRAYIPIGKVWNGLYELAYNTK